MRTLFNSDDGASIQKRLASLERSTTRQWGKMDAAQMLTHCSLALEMVLGDRPMRQTLLGKIVTPFIRASVLGEKPFSRNGPTDPTLVVADQRDFDVERQRLSSAVDRFCQLGPSHAALRTHVFFGRLTGEEWGRLMYKHLDHHLRQFGA